MLQGAVGSPRGPCWIVGCSAVDPGGAWPARSGSSERARACRLWRKSIRFGAMECLCAPDGMPCGTSCRKGSRVLCDRRGLPLTQREVQVTMRRVGRKTQVKAGVHILRHTFCSHLAMKGAAARAIQELARHQDLTTTQRYMHLSPAALDSAIRLLDGANARSGCWRDSGDGGSRTPESLKSLDRGTEQIHEIEWVGRCLSVPITRLRRAFSTTPALRSRPAAAKSSGAGAEKSARPCQGDRFGVTPRGGRPLHRSLAHRWPTRPLSDGCTP